MMRASTKSRRCAGSELAVRVTVAPDVLSVKRAGTNSSVKLACRHQTEAPATAGANAALLTDVSTHWIPSKPMDSTCVEARSDERAYSTDTRRQNSLARRAFGRFVRWLKPGRVMRDLVKRCNSCFREQLPRIWRRYSEAGNVVFPAVSALETIAKSY